MPTTKSKLSLLKILIILTVFFVCWQISLACINFLSQHLIDSFISASITKEIFYLKVFNLGLLKFLFSQLLIYTILIYSIWYLAVSLGELAALSQNKILIIGIFLWLTTVITLLAANAYFTPYSFFARLIREAFYQQHLSDQALHAFNQQLIYTFTIGCGILFSAAFLALINLIQSFSQKKNPLRHSAVLLFLTVIFSVLIIDKRNTQAIPTTAATASQPNIIMIGIDGVRQDCIGYYNKKIALTPSLDAFLKSSIEFSNSYTTLARTFPSWSSLLTSAYPKNTNARGNNTDLEFIRLDETLAKTLKQAGYETIYGTDDTRFNNTNEAFGFDHIISPPMGVNDFILGTINDFPLSNLLIPTPFGKWLFPYNFANHGTPLTYSPNNFLQMIRGTLHQREQKPLFLAVHFTITHWPFYWFNDKQKYDNREIVRYLFTMHAIDNQFQQFLTVLTENHLLDHAIVILLSDHGVALGVPGDRVVAANRYVGNPVNIKKISVAKFNSAQDDTVTSIKDFSINTAYGYGGDLLNFAPYHILLAFKGYGLNLGPNHTVNERVSIMDIAPTLLSLLHLPAFKHSDGISLEPYLFDVHFSKNENRPFFFETSFSVEEIEKENISVNEVVQKALKLYRIAPQTGLVFVKSKAETIMNKDKQFGILQGDWLLVRYPKSYRAHLTFSQPDHHGGFELENLPPYLVLINLKSGLWTTELQTPFALASPAESLLGQLQAFYGADLGMPGYAEIIKTSKTRLESS